MSSLGKIKETLEKIPPAAILGLFFLYYGWEYYNLTEGPASPIKEKENQVSLLKTENATLQKKVAELEAFVKTLEGKKQELRALAQDLDDLKTTLSEDLDVPAFMKMVITEAKKMRLTVTSFKPSSGGSKKDLYGEQEFQLTFRGVFSQLILFLDRLANTQRLTRVETFSIRPVGNQGAKFVELEGNMTVKAYYYIGSKADEVVKSPGASVAPSPAPAGAAAGGSK